MARESFAMERMRFRPRAEDAAPERSSGNRSDAGATNMAHLRCWTWIIPFRKTGLKCGRAAKFRPTGLTRLARRLRTKRIIEHRLSRTREPENRTTHRTSRFAASVPTSARVCHGRLAGRDDSSRRQRRGIVVEKQQDKILAL